jgi:hypothetical protein
MADATDPDPDAHAHRLEQARALLEELGYTANSDGSFSPPRREAPASASGNSMSPEAQRRASAEAAAQGMRELLARNRQPKKAPEKVARSADLKPTEAVLRQFGISPKATDEPPKT